MNPQHGAMLRAIEAGSITCTGNSPRRYFFDGSPVEPFATSVLDDLLHDELAHIVYRCTVELTDAGWDAVRREAVR